MLLVGGSVCWGCLLVCQALPGGGGDLQVVVVLLLVGCGSGSRGYLSSSRLLLLWQLQCSSRHLLVMAVAWPPLLEFKVCGSSNLCRNNSSQVEGKLSSQEEFLGLA